MKILIINGPNLNLILSRNKDHYGDKDLATIESLIISKFQDVNTSFLTTNDENEIITILQEADRNFDGIVINPGAYTHVSLGIRDALEICKIPKIEVHLSNLTTREKFRNQFLTTSRCDGYISGFKHIGYFAAIFALKEMINQRNNE